MYQIEGKLAEELLALIEANNPREVGGLIIDGREVVVLPNRAKKDSAFEFRTEDIRRFVIDRELIVGMYERVALWHSHPNGGVGPSREDMRNRTPLKYHLVVAYVEGDLVPTWY